MSINNNIHTKNPGGVLDYKFDWKARTNQASVDPEITNWLESSEIISSYFISASMIPSSGSSGSMISVVNSYLADSNTSVVVWLGGGDLGKDYSVGCYITTNSSPVARKDDRNIKIMIRDL